MKVKLKAVKRLIAAALAAGMMLGNSAAYAAEFKTVAPETLKPAAAGEAVYDLEYYQDVDPFEWYYGAIAYVDDQGIMNGYTQDRFAPLEKLTRGDFATILYRLSGKPTVTYEAKFKDVVDGMYYSPAIIWAEKNGIITGYTEDTFGTFDPISREQIATILFRYSAKTGKDTSARVDLNSYPDVEYISDWAMEAMSYSVASGLIKGDGVGNLKPYAGATRAEIATILTRYDGGSTNSDWFQRISYSLHGVAEHIEKNGTDLYGYGKCVEYIEESDGYQAWVMITYLEETDDIMYEFQAYMPEEEAVIVSIWTMGIKTGRFTSEIASTAYMADENGDPFYLFWATLGGVDRAKYTIDTELNFQIEEVLDGLSDDVVQELSNLSFKAGIVYLHERVYAMGIGGARNFGFDSFKY